METIGDEAGIHDFIQELTGQNIIAADSEQAHEPHHTIFLQVLLHQQDSRSHVTLQKEIIKTAFMNLNLEEDGWYDAGNNCIIYEETNTSTTATLKVVNESHEKTASHATKEILERLEFDLSEPENDF